MYVLNPQLQPVPIGVPGELCAAGDGVALGYLDDPERTAERFVPDPFSNLPGARMYRTGDRVRYLVDGTLEFLGRLDRQVKIRGFRVEPEETEAALLDYPGVMEAAVVVREVVGEKQLVAYVAAAPGAERSSEVWQDYLKKRLPDYMVPTVVVTLNQLPHSAHQKIDRAALPSLDPAPVHRPEKAGDPVSLLELELLRIWQRLFGRSDIGRQDNFFDLGGHSLLAARLVTEVEKLGQRPVPIALLFQHPTVASLARALEEDGPLPDWTSLVPLQPTGPKPPIFFTHGLGGNVYAVLNLARSLSPEQPVYGLQAVGLDGRHPRHRRLEEMAAHYVREIRSFQPQGPYYLGGYSLGGWIAYEVAQQLSKRGQRVALLALIDTGPVCPVAWGLYAATMTLYLIARPCWHLRRCVAMPGAQRRSYLLGRLKSLAKMMSQLIQRNRPLAPPIGPPTEPRPLPAEVPSDYYHQVVKGYSPRKYEGTIDLFRAEGSAVFLPFFWRRMARRVQVHRLRGDHAGLMAGENLENLSQGFREALRQAQLRAAQPEIK